jgi:hypothetical protein
VSDGNQGEVGYNCFCNGHMSRDDFSGVKGDAMLLMEDVAGVNRSKFSG